MLSPAPSPPGGTAPGTVLSGGRRAGFFEPKRHLQAIGGERPSSGVTGRRDGHLDYPGVPCGGVVSCTRAEVWVSDGAVSEAERPLGRLYHLVTGEVPWNLDHFARAEESVAKGPWRRVGLRPLLKAPNSRSSARPTGHARVV